MSDIVSLTAFWSGVMMAEGFVALIFSGLVWVRRGVRPYNFLYAGIALLVGVICILAGGFNLVPSPNIAFQLAVAVYVGISLLFPLFFLFLLYLYDQMESFFLWKQFLVGISFSAMVGAVLTPGNFLISVGGGDGWSKTVEYGPAISAFVVYCALYLTFSITVLVKNYVESAGVFRSHFLYLLLGLLISGTFAFFTNIFLPLLGFFDLIWLGVTVLFAYSATVGFFLAKYNFWNMRLLLTELFVALIGVMLLFNVVLWGKQQDFLIDSVIILLAGVSGYFLIKSVRKEGAIKEEVSRLLKELEDANAQLKILDEKKSNFVSAASFNLRAPLTTIRGYASLLLEGTFGNLTASVLSALGVIFQSSKNLSMIVDDFTDILKLERGETTYVFTSVDLKHLIESILPEMAVSAEKAGLALYFETDGDRDYTTRADTGRIRQAISNLIDNAIKYTPRGYVELSLSRNKSKGTILLTIRDTGVGMTRDTLESIFSKFNRGEDAKKIYTGGAGLGLYVTKEILKKHDARVWADSQGKDKGSVFYIEFKHADAKI